MKVAFVIHQVEYSIPLGIAYCASALEREGFECEIFEIGLDPEACRGAIRSYRPSLVGFSIYTGSHELLLGFCRMLKKEIEFISVFGGPHATFFPEVIQEDGIDAVCRGEGEIALAEFARKFRERGRIPDDIENFLVKIDGEVTENPVRPLERNLDDLAPPDRLLFTRKFPFYNRYGIKHFVAHRGCPYQCTYCFNHAFNNLYRVQGKECYRSRDPEKVCDEILFSRDRMRVDMVSFVDDCFALDRDWTLEFCRVYGERIGLPFQINTRAENLDEEIVRALSASGCWLIHVGVEAGDEKFRRETLKRRMSNQLLTDRIALCRRAGIHILTENIVGFPTETYRGALTTLKLNMRIKPDFATASFFYPYPKLELTGFAIEQGLYNPDVDVLGIDYMHASPLKFATARDKRRITNLRSFFNLAIRHQWLFPVLERMTALPSNPVFRFVGDLADGYYLWKLLPYRIGMKDVLNLIRRYLVAYRKTLTQKSGPVDEARAARAEES